MHKKELRELIAAMCLGDGGVYLNYRIQKATGNKVCHSAFFQVGHSPKQYDYLKWKMSLIQEILDKKGIQKRTIIRQVFHTLKCSGKTYEGYQGKFYWKEYLWRIQRKIYPKHRNNKKTIKWLLEQTYSPLHLAIWFADDGSETKRKTKHIDGTIYHCNPYYRLYLGNISEGDVNLAIEWFRNKWNVYPRKQLDKKRNCWQLNFKAGESKILFGHMSSYLCQIPSMQQKFSWSFIKYWRERPSGSSNLED